MTHRETSKEIFETIKQTGFLKGWRLKVYEHLFQHGPLTAQQLIEQLHPKNRSTVDARLGELKRMAAVRNTGETTNDSGHKVLLWDVTNNSPKKLAPSPWLQPLYDRGLETYQEYLNCSHWVNFRVDYWSRHSKICFITGRPAIDLHHKNYDCLFNEEDKDITPVSREAHFMIEQIIKKNKVPRDQAHNVAKFLFKGFTLLRSMP